MKLLILFFLTIFIAFDTSAQTLQRVLPEQVGLSSKRLLYADRAILKAIDNDEIPGAVLAVVKDGKMAYLKAYGNSRLYPEEVAMNVNTVFDMASCSKSISTAISTMILIERGELRLMDSVRFFIPNFREWCSEDGIKKKIRIVDLLTHTSGLPAYASVTELQEIYGAPNPSGLLEYISTCERNFEPQTDFQYSCLNYIALQSIIEVISGQSLRDFAKENIFDILGMKYTDYLPTKQKRNGKWVNTIDYEWSDLIAPTERQIDGRILCGQVHDPLARIMNGGISGNAGVFSNANDIAILAAAILNGGELNGCQILSPLGVRAMRMIPSNVVPMGRTLGWDLSSAYNLNQGDLFGSNTFGHTGYTGTSIILDPDINTACILLTNAVHLEDEYKIARLRSLVANVVAASVSK